ncbi:FliH/SctL family protein [Rhodopirellula sallentina]|uniref:Flagellar assembly protein FliH n=1 Tax=Rhodopirellula sallentina SM41 TaxID=1263870 RepID=M5U7Z7_9BACT|nr:FliH/SctL family protein [Rhodopirellula sallentina]EMI57399.1 flagellar assembly protein FliH [Rhodopirellula sallentina SM41]
MATIVKPGDATAKTAASANPADPPNPADPNGAGNGSGAVSVPAGRTGRVIKTVSVAKDDGGAKVDETPLAPVRPPGTSGRISGATVGEHAKGKTGLAEFNLSDLAAEGQEQIKRCQQQVDAMLAEATKQAEQLRQQARTQGHSEGTQAAIKEIDQRVNREAESKARNQVKSLHQAVEQMKQQYDAWMRQYAEVLTTTAIAAAERLTRSQLVLPNAEDGYAVVDPSPANTSGRDIASGREDAEPAEHLLVRWAREALHSTRSASRLTLAVHPDTLAQLGKALDELLAHPDLPEQSVVIPDESLKVGDVVVRQDGGEISAGIDAQLDRLREELL